MLKKIIGSSAAFVALSAAASLLNFLYYPVIARYLSFAEYGDTQVGIALIMQAAALFSALNVIALYYMAQFGTQQSILASVERLAIALATVIAIVIAIFAEPIASRLQLHDARLLYILSVILIINIPAATWLGALQGNGQFVLSGSIQVVSAIVKISSSLLLLAAGFGAYGALVGVLLGLLMVLPLAYIFQSSNSISFRRTFQRLQMFDLDKLRKNQQLTYVFFGLFSLAIASTVDIIFAKSVLEPTAAGTYALVSTAAKIPYFAAVPLTLIFFERLIRDPLYHRRLLCIFIVILFCLTSATILLSRPILFVMAGSINLDTTLFIYLSISFSLYALVTMLVYRLLSIRRIFAAVVVCVLNLLAPVLALSLYGHTSRTIAIAYLFCQFAGVIIVSVLQYRAGWHVKHR